MTATLPAIYGAAKAYAAQFGRVHEWEDIAQSALLKMLRFADLYNPAKGDLLPWACVVIINTIKTHVAQESAAPDMEEFNALIIDRTPAAAIYDTESQMQADFILAHLNEELRLFVEGYTYKEIAALRGFKSKVTAFDRIGKCADHLRRILGISTPQGRRQRNRLKAPA